MQARCKQVSKSYHRFDIYSVFISFKQLLLMFQITKRARYYRTLQYKSIRPEMISLINLLKETKILWESGN